MQTNVGHGRATELSRLPRRTSSVCASPGWPSFSVKGEKNLTLQRPTDVPYTTFPTLPKNLKVVSQVPSSVFTSPPLHFPDGEQQFTTLTLLPAHSKFAFGDGGTYHSGSEAPSACSSAFHVPG